MNTFELPPTNFHETPQAEVSLKPLFSRNAKSEQGRSVDNAEMQEESFRALEERMPGSLAALQSNYGLEHFQRYPASVLEQMLTRDAEGDERPYGLLIYAKADHNGAMSHVRQLLEMHEAIGSTHTMRIVECKSVEEALEAMNSLSSKFGKADFAVICGHGSPGHISLGGESQEAALTSENVVQQFGTALDDFLQSGAEVCLFSCSTGREGAIAQDISDSSERTTIAPEQDTPLVSFGATVQAGHVHFKPVYGRSDAKTANPDSEPSGPIDPDNLEVGDLQRSN